MHPQTLDVQPDLGENRTGFSIRRLLLVFWVITINPILATCISDAVFSRMN
jgi:hypothetical protein